MEDGSGFVVVLGFDTIQAEAVDVEETIGGLFFIEVEGADELDESFGSLAFLFAIACLDGDVIHLYQQLDGRHGVELVHHDFLRHGGLERTLCGACLALVNLSGMFGMVRHQFFEVETLKNRRTSRQEDECRFIFG